MSKSNVKSYTDEQILNRVKEKAEGFKGFPKGVMDVWVRSNEDEYDRFDDKVYTFECYGDEKPPKFIMVCTGTTNAGSQGLKNFAKYNSKGCAVLQADIIVYNSHDYGKHKGKYAAYVQSTTVGFPYFRDNDKDNKAEEIGKKYSDRIGANCHKAGWNSELIGGWSVACLVRNQQPQYDAWMKYMNKRPLTVCILNEW